MKFDYRRLTMASLVSASYISAHDHHHHHHDQHRELDEDRIGPSRCGTMDPSFAEQREAARYVQNWVRNSIDSPRNTILVDIQFHVIHDGNSGRLARKGIVDSLKVLNEAFAEPGFQFIERGNPTYTNNPGWFNAGMSRDRAMKETLRVGGPTTLNVYFNRAGGNLGYATFPGRYSCDPTGDGVVIHHNSIPGGNYPFDEGDTLVHEVGHWLGLYHTFQGGCFAGDAVSDTPAQKNPTSGCPTDNPPDSCGRFSPDPIHNFMDYSDDRCMSEFTAGQIDRMRALWGKRTNPGACNYLCFSPNVTTHVQGKGYTAIRDIVPGDKVLTGSGTHQTVYTISHYHHSEPIKFLQIHTTTARNGNDREEYYDPLEITEKHLIFIEGQSYPISAMNLKVGDFLQTLIGEPSREVTNITLITRNGYYNPITTDGTIVVDGVIASTYTLFIDENDSTHITIAGYPFISIQTFLDMTFAPYRVFCLSISFNLCNQHGEGKLPHVIREMNRFYDFWSHQTEIVQFVVFLLYITFFTMLSYLASPSGILVTLAILLLGAGWFMVVSLYNSNREKQIFRSKNHSTAKGSQKEKNL